MSRALEENWGNKPRRQAEKFSWDKRLVYENATEIVKEIAKNLKTKISPDELKKISTEPSKNAEANMNYTEANAISYTAWSAFNMGNKYVESISFKAAIQKYDKAIYEDPQFAQAYAKRAIAWSLGYFVGQLDSTAVVRCLEDINAAKRINKPLPDIEIAQGFYYHYCTRELEKALEHFGKATEMSPGDFQPLFYMSMVYRRMGEWNKCLQLIRKIIRLNPQDALCLTNIGLTYDFVHEYDSALMYHQKAIVLLPVWVSPYRNKIETLVHKYGNTTEARRFLDTAVQRTGGNFRKHRMMLNLYDKKFNDALTDLGKSEIAQYDFPGVKYLYQAEIYNYMNKFDYSKQYYDSALVSLNRELKIKWKSSKLHGYIGLANVGTGNKSRAIEEGKLAVDMIRYNNVDKSDMILILAKIYTMANEYDQAVEAIDYLLQNRLDVPSNFSMSIFLLDPVWKPLLALPEVKSMIVKYSNKYKS